MAKSQVNSVKLESLRDTQEDLHAPLQRLFEVFQERREEQQLVDALVCMRRDLSTHFDLEEADGYLNDAVAHTPILMRQASDLLDEHAAILQQLDEFIAAAEHAPPTKPWWDDASQRVDHFVATLLAHDSAEQQLIKDAFDADT